MDKFIDALKNKNIEVEIQSEWFSSEQCRKNTHKLYVFGDNMIRAGKGGQATIRDEYNSYGIATKRLPSMNNNSFFGDKHDEMMVLYNDINNLINTMIYDGFDVVVLPADGLGTGLSKMPQKSPKLFKWMNNTISLIFNIEYNPK